MRVFRWVLRGAGQALLALVLLAALSTAQAAITFTDTSNLATPWSVGGLGADTVFSASNSFTVTAAQGSSVLVVPYDEYATNATGIDATPTIQWVTSGGTQTLLLAASQVSNAGSYTYAQVYYLFNPDVGSGTITLSGQGRAYAMNAYTLSGVNTSVPAPVPYVSTTGVPATLTLANTTAPFAFAATAETDRLSNNTGTLPGWTFTSTTGTASLPWFRVDAPGTGQVGLAAGYVTGLSAGATTISSSPANTNGTGNRNVMAAAIFTPNVGTLTWTGTAGNGNWDIVTTKNWQNPNTLGYYIEPNNGVLFDDTSGNAGGTSNVMVTQVVSPFSVTFNNNAYPYTLTASGAGAISGGGSVTLSGTGLVNMNLANSYTGGTTVSSGTLSIGNANGSATGTGPVTIAAGATLSGSGFISTSGTNTVSVSGSITPDLGPGIYNTLTASALSLNSGSTLNLNFLTTSPGQHDLIGVTGSLTLALGTVNINAANLSGTWTPGAYPFLNYGSLTGSPAFNLVNTLGSLGSSQMSINESVPGVISLDVLSAAASRTVSWAGNVNTGGSYLWDIANTLNWTSSGSASVYNEGNRVVFSNTASNFAVTVNQQVNPSSVTFSNSSDSYTLGGSGGINSTTLGVAVNGGGTVTFNNTNAYTTATTVTNGSTLIVNGSLPSSNVLVTGAFIGGTGQLGATPASLSLNGATALTAGSDLTVNGAANVSSGTFTIPAGTTFSGNGGINVSSSARLALDGIVDFNQIVNLNGAVLSGGGTLNGGLSNSGTSSISSGIISANGPWTGSGAINVASGSELLLGGAASTTGVTLNVSGTLNGTSGAPVNSPVNVFGNGIANINAGTVPNLTALGGTTSLAGATVNVATVSGSNAVVNVTAGSVPILNVGNSNLTSGVTVFPGASACTTSLSVSGGLLTLQNSDTIPTAALSGGTTNLEGPNMTVTAATVSGNAVVNVTAAAGYVPSLSVAGGLVTVGPAVNAGLTALTISGGSVTLYNGNTTAAATFSGGTTNLAGPTVPTATVSGSNTVVNVTAGSVPNLIVASSNLISGVTVSSSASACSQSLTVSGGLVNLYNSDTIPAAALSGGTTNFSGPSMTVANISGAAVVNVNVGNVATLNQSGSATTTISSSATVPTLYVTGGRVNISNTSAVTLLQVTGGTVNLPGTTTVNTADFTSASTAYVPPRTLLVTNQLKLNGGNTATISNGNTFNYVSGGTNMASSSPVGTLTFSGGVLTLTPLLGTENGTAINVGVALNGNSQGTKTYTGPGPSSDLGTYWNNPTNTASGYPLLNSSGGSTTATYTITGAPGSYEEAASSNLLTCYNDAPATYTFSGLTPGATYNLYGITDNNTPGRQMSYNILSQGGVPSQVLTTPANWNTGTLANTSAFYCEFAGLTANASGQLVISSSAVAGDECDSNGLQLVPVFTSGNANFANTNIVAPAGSTLDFGGCGPANAIGGLSLAGNLTVQNVVSGGSVQVGGDVVASANATVSLASGAGSVPTLVLTGNTNGIQNISAANGSTLTLPAVSISPATVRFNASGGTGSVVVLSGATALTNAGGAAATVNAGTLKVQGTLTGAGGAGLTVNSGATLAGGPAGLIQVPVTVNFGGTLLPDATAASTALIGNSLSIQGGALQWVYSGSGAEGTLALGSSTLGLVSPVFRPQFVTQPPLGTYVMTWSSPPASQPAWSFDGSLVGVGHVATWADSNGNWDTGSNWNYAVATSATLTYQPTGLQLTSLTVNNVAGTAPPVSGASVLIAPPSNSSVSVTGPGEPVTVGTLVIEGSGAATASLTLQGAGPITASSVAVGAGGSFSDDGGSGSGALVMPSGILSLSHGSVNLGNGSTNVGAATMNSGVFSLSGGNVGVLAASGGAVSVGGGTVGTAQVSGAAVLNASGGNLALLTASGGSATAASGVVVGAATVSGGVVNLSNANTMGNLMASGGATTLNGPTVTTATVSGNAVVNITGGSVPTLNVLSSDTSTGVTASAGATVGSTALGVSGGLVTLYNTNAIPTAALSGGTTNLLGPMVITANASGSALVNVGSASTVATANVSANAVVNVNGANSVTAANVSGGQLNANFANAVSGPTTISGGTVSVADAGGLGLQQSTVTVNANNSLAYSGPSATLGGLAGSASFNLPSSTLSVGANGANTNFGGTMTGAGGLTKIGAGTLLLTNSNVYAGPTVVNAGTLKLNYGSGLAVNGFNNGTGWSVNTVAETTAAFNGGTLTLLDNSGPENRSAWYDIPVPTSGFSTSFIYTVGGAMVADGITFCLQADPRGLTALGGNGGNLGYNGITPSVAVPFNIDMYNATLNTNNPVSQSGFWTNGVLGSYITTGSVNIEFGDPIQVTLSYNGATQALTENLLDLAPSASGATFTTTLANVNLASLLGSTTAYMGFTGADYVTSTQQASNFAYNIISPAVSILPATTALVVSASGTFDLGGNNQTVASLSDGIGGGGTVINSYLLLPSVLTVGPTGGSSTFSGSIEGGGGLGTLGLSVSGAGTLVLAGTNTYTGGTYVEGNATLIATNNEAIADGSDLFVGSAAGLAEFGTVQSAGAGGQAGSPVAPVPEPGTLALLAAGAAAAVAAVRRGRRIRPLRKR